MPVEMRMTPQEAINALLELDKPETELEAMDVVGDVMFGTYDLEWGREFMAMYQQHEFRFQTNLSLLMYVSQTNEPLCDLQAFGEYCKRSIDREGIAVSYYKYVDSVTDRDWDKPSALQELVHKLNYTKQLTRSEDASMH